jgi:hypothetical protein
MTSGHTDGDILETAVLYGRQLVLQHQGPVLRFYELSRMRENIQNDDLNDTVTS